MVNFDFEQIKTEIISSMDEQMIRFSKSEINKTSFRQAVLSSLEGIADKYYLTPIRNERLFLDSQQTVDLVFYDNEGTSLLAIVVADGYLKRAISNLDEIITMHKLLISYNPDHFFITNLLKLFNGKRDIELIHLPGLKFIKSNYRRQTIMGTSPLEERMEQSLIEEGIGYVSQQPVYQTKKHSFPKYVLDFVVKGKAAKVIVECDGLMYHQTTRGKIHDSMRDLWLMRYGGYDDILRFHSDEIIHNMESVMKRIKMSLEDWDVYHEKRKRKADINPSQLEDPVQEHVEWVVRELAPAIRDTLKQSRKEKREKQFIHHINKVIYKAGYSADIAYFYFHLPELYMHMQKIHGIFVGYNSLYAFYYLSEKGTDIPEYIQREKRIVKLLVGHKSSQLRALKEGNMKSWVYLDAKSGDVIGSDIIPVYLTTQENQMLLHEEKKENIKVHNVPDVRKRPKIRVEKKKQNNRRQNTATKIPLPLHISSEMVEETLRNVYRWGELKKDEDYTEYEDFLRKSYRNKYKGRTFQQIIKSLNLFEEIPDKTLASLKGSLSSFWAMELKQTNLEAIDTFYLANKWMKVKYRNYYPHQITIHDLSFWFQNYKIQRKRKAQVDVKEES